MLTGLYAGGEGAVHIANLTKQAGYSNIMSGKEHFDPWVPEYCKAEKVFDHSFYFWATTEYFLPPSGAFERPFYLEGKELRADEIEHEKSPMYKTDFITDYALKWLDETFEKEEPFFLYLPYHAAHYPLQARGPFLPDYTDYYAWDSLSDAKKDSLDLEMAVYAAIIDRMDQNIGRVLKKLEENGKMDNTIIMYLNDNGSIKWDMWWTLPLRFWIC